MSIAGTHAHIRNWLAPHRMICGVSMAGRVPVEQVRDLTCDRCVLCVLRTGQALGWKEEEIKEWSLEEMRTLWTKERAEQASMERHLEGAGMSVPTNLREALQIVLSYEARAFEAEQIANLAMWEGKKAIAREVSCARADERKRVGAPLCTCCNPEACSDCPPCEGCRSLLTHAPRWDAMSVEQILEVLKTAPLVAGAWEKEAGVVGTEGWMRVGVGSRVCARVRPTTEDPDVPMWLCRVGLGGYFEVADLETAKKACDHLLTLSGHRLG